MNIYTQDNLPATIGQAIYFYGDNNIKDILLYGEIDAEHGFILTSESLYYQFNAKDKIQLKEITEITLNKVRNQPKKYTIVASGVYHLFDESQCDCEDLIELLLEHTQLTLQYTMSVHEKIYYFSDIILHDIQDDVYEDTILTPLQSHTLTTLIEKLEASQTMENQAFIIEMQLIVDQVMKLVEELELDSEEIDELEKAQQEVNAQEDQMFDQFKDMYTNNKDTIKNVTGIDLDDINNKSPEELNSMLDDLCNRFNISKDQLAALASKFNKKH